MNGEDIKHLAICPLMKQEHPARMWYCVKCDVYGHGLGCPAHACAIDPVETTYGKNPNEKRD